MIIASRNFGLEVEKKIEKNIIEENNDTDDNFTMILNNLRDRDIMLKPVMIDNMIIKDNIENTESANNAEHTANSEITEITTKIDNLVKIKPNTTIENRNHDFNDTEKKISSDNNLDKKNIDSNDDNIKIEIEMEIMTALVPFGDMLNHERPRQVREIFFEDKK